MKKVHVIGDSTVRYTELFTSVQGEGRYTGKLSMFFRFFGCNLSCQGFFQEHPTMPTTYKDPLAGVEPKTIKRLEDLPVFQYGCDTGYSVSAKFKHLAEKATVHDIGNKMMTMVPQDWKHNHSNADVHLVFTGGEPLLWQDEMIDIVFFLVDSGNYPKFITVETNGTKPLSAENIERIKELRDEYGIEWQWSVSPKLWTVSGEDEAINFDAWDTYFQASSVGYLKFVVNGTDVCWEELNYYVDLLQMPLNGHLAREWEVYVMPCGATLEQQSDLNYIKAIAERALKEGYQISGRLHVNLFGNGVNT